MQLASHTHTQTHIHTHTQANNNGIISFQNTLREWRSESFPLAIGDAPEIAIAPFWADVDTLPDIDGENLYYRLEDAPELLSLANEYVHAGFVGYRDFAATELVIITWDRVGYYNEKTDKVCA